MAWEQNELLVFLCSALLNDFLYFSRTNLLVSNNTSASSCDQRQTDVLILLNYVSTKFKLLIVLMFVIFSSMWPPLSAHTL